MKQRYILFFFFFFFLSTSSFAQQFRWLTGGGSTEIMNNGVYKGQRVLSEASVKELKTIQTSSNLIKYAADEANGFQYALGAWAPEQNEKQATILAAPSLGGTIPVVDFCRGYAFVYFLKDLTDDQKVNAYSEIKEILNSGYPSSCR